MAFNKQMKEMLTNTKLKCKKTLTFCLMISIALIGTYFFMLDKSQFFHFSSATVSFELRNESNKSLDASFFLFVGSGSLNFHNTKISKLHGNFSVGEMSDESGLEIDCIDLAASDYLSFRAEEIKTTSMLQSTQNTKLDLSFNYGNQSDFGYRGVVSLLNDQEISVASRYYHTVRLSDGSSYLRYEERTTSAISLNALIAAMTAFFTGAVAMTVCRRAKWFTIVSVSILLVTISLYVFVGSGYEINGRNWWWLFPVSIFIHGDDQHIVWNLVFFMILSVLFELFLKTKAHSVKRQIARWYFVPLFLPIICSVPSLLATQQFSFGLSYSIEIMTWVLWAYIMKHYHELIRNRIYLLMAILSGIPSTGFLEWTVQKTFGFIGNPYDDLLAVGHIWFGIITGLLVVLVVFGQDIKHWMKKICSNGITNFRKRLKSVHF